MSRHILPNYPLHSSSSHHAHESPQQQQYSHHGQPPQHLNITSYPYTGSSGDVPSSASTMSGHTPGGGDGGGFGGPAGGGNPQKPTYAKRGKITIVACVPCRRRKTKCDGHRPSCGQCASRNNTCLYDMTDDQRKLTHLRENVEHLQDKSNSFESLLHTIQNSHEREAEEVFKRLRSGQDLYSIAEDVQASHVLSGVGVRGREQRSGKSRSIASIVTLDNQESMFNDHRVSGLANPGTASVSQQSRQSGRHLDFERLIRSIALSDTKGGEDIVKRLKQREEISAILTSVDQTSIASPRLVQRSLPGSLENNFARGDQTFGMIKNATGQQSVTSYLGHASEFREDRQTTPWTYVTDDNELIEHLVEHYFTWQHSFFQSFPEKLFKSDMAAGRTKYCSSVLVSVICACGAFLSPRPDVVEPRRDGKTLVDLFYEEAIDYLRRDESSSLTTTAALGLVSYIEGTKGRLSALWMTTGRSTLMSTDINLHLRKTHSQQSPEDEQALANESKARAHAFWGSFHLDTTTAFTLGRLPNYNIHGITVDLPTIDDQEDEEPWHPNGTEHQDYPYRPGARSTTFHHTATLSEIINMTLLMFFAPTVSLSGTLLVEHYERYLAWKHALPDMLKEPRGSPPHILSLHMYYHSAVLLLFRPFLKAKIINSPDIAPRDVCRQSANEISQLFSYQLESFGLQGLCMFQVHCLLTACTIHVVNIPTISATDRLTTACDALQHIGHRNEWALSSLSILRGLVEKWNLVLPQEAEEALYRGTAGPGTETGMGHAGTMSSSSSSHRRDDNRPSFAAPIDPGSSHANKNAKFQPPRSKYGRDLPDSHPTESSSSKRPSSRPHQPSRDSTSNSSIPTPATQKRQRIMASNPSTPTSATTPKSAASAHAQGQESKPQHPSSFLYSPLSNQPAPFLVPVRAHRSPYEQGGNGGNGGNGRGDSNLQSRDSTSSSEAASNTNPHNPTRGSTSGYTSSSTPGTDYAMGSGYGQQAQAQSQQQQSQEHAMVGLHASELAPMELGDFPNAVEGLSFNDDWRDPFMGFGDFE